MGMSDENIVDTGEVDILFLQYLEDAVSTTCIHYHGSIFILNGEAGIITFDGLCVAGSKNSKSSHGDIIVGIKTFVLI